MNIQNSKYKPYVSVVTTKEDNLGKGLSNRCVSVAGILAEDVDFAEYNSDGVLLSTYSISELDSSGNPSSYIMTKEEECISGQMKTDRFNIPNILQPFRKITLTRTDVTEILSVKDSAGNQYYEVDSLTQDTVFKRVQNLDEDRDIRMIIYYRVDYMRNVAQDLDLPFAEPREN